MKHPQPQHEPSSTPSHPLHPPRHLGGCATGDDHETRTYDDFRPNTPFVSSKKSYYTPFRAGSSVASREGIWNAMGGIGLGITDFATIPNLYLGAHFLRTSR